jgi:hypothetical protein
MAYDTRAILRGLGALGATIAVLATFFAWYSFEVVLAAGGAARLFVVPVTLWDLTTLAPVLITVGAIVALFCLAMVDSRVAGVVTALIGLGITIYAFVRLFDVPSLGVRDAAALARGVRATTTVDGGVPLELVAGIMLMLGSLGDLMRRREEPAAAAPGREEGARWQRERAEQPDRTRSER